MLSAADAAGLSAPAKPTGGSSQQQQDNKAASKQTNHNSIAEESEDDSSASAEAPKVKLEPATQDGTEGEECDGAEDEDDAYTTPLRKRRNSNRSGR